MHKKAVRLAPSEWEIMQVLWDRNRALSVREVLSVLYPNSEKAYTTVQTVMNNLEQKGALKKEKIGLVNFYEPIINREQAVREETRNFVKKVFDGSFQGLANYLIESDDLTRDDISQLKKMIEDREKELRSKSK